MCENCGCGEGLDEKWHEHAHAHGLAHSHDDEHHSHAHEHSHNHDAHGHTHDHAHAHAPDSKRLTVEQKVLAHNDEIAASTRRLLAEKRIVALNLISSPGSGKTMLLEKTLDALRDKVKCAVIVGDQQTDNDAQRLAGRGAAVRQIETINSCHLNAQQVADVLPEVLADNPRLLFIENVGNLVCPAAFDLGESFKVALVSTPEGEDKPVKYPILFAGAKLVVLTKMDLADCLEWDEAACRRYVQQIQPGMMTFALSAKTGEGMDSWLEYLSGLLL